MIQGNKKKKINKKLQLNRRKKDLDGGRELTGNYWKFGQREGKHPT